MICRVPDLAIIYTHAIRAERKRLIVTAKEHHSEVFCLRSGAAHSGDVMLPQQAIQVDNDDDDGVISQQLQL